MVKSFLSLLILAAAILSQVTHVRATDVTVTVTNIPGAEGNLLVGLYDSEKTFTKVPVGESAKVPLTSTKDVTVTFDDVAPGRYAIAVIQDLNGNGKLDKTFVGMPKEPLAFSVIREIPKGKPKFAACAFTVGENPVKMTIPLVLE
ncbi:MAG: DUF2141 domain-containing protein [Verrucomicrobiota bacterium]